MAAKLFRAAAKDAQKLADAETDPQLKAAHLKRVDEMNEWALTADVQRKLGKAIAAAKKGA